MPKPLLADLIAEAPVQVRGGLVPAPAAPTNPPPGRFGELSRARLEELVQLAATVWDVDPNAVQLAGL